MTHSTIDTALNRLRLWQKFAVLALFGVVLVAAPFILYVHESGKTIQATRQESSGLRPMRLLMKTLQLAQQHRGLAMITLNGDASAEARRTALQGETDQAFEALDAALRLLVVRRPLRYALSIWGIIDLLAILPTYLSLLLPGAQTLLVVRALRILRVFRILKLTRYIEESGILMQALWRSRRKILLFLSLVITIAIVAGSLMYVIEGPSHGFSNIPASMYWAVVTMATVGFGDIVPQTTLGRFVTSALILIGYSIIAVPTGIYTAELANGMRQAEAAAGRRRRDDRGCVVCGHEGHEPAARYCNRCGHELPEPLEP